MLIANKDNTMVLLGAGASAEAGVPMSFAMTRKIIRHVCGRPQWLPTDRLLRFVCEALITDDASRGEDREDLDLERVFTAVELLSRRRDLDVTPFVAAWRSPLDELDPMPAFDVESGDGRVGRALAFQMMEALVASLATTEDSVRYLIPLVTAGQRRRGISIATLNYDLSIELACTSAHVPVHTGLESWAAEGRWRWPTRGVRLLKLHGSIDWAWQQDYAGDVNRMPPRQVLLSDPGDPQVLEVDRALLFGHGGAKLRADGPFLPLLAQFESQLAAANRLVIIGYSFRDTHINEILRRWVNDDLQRNVIIIDPHFPDHDEVMESDPLLNLFRDELYISLHPDAYRRPGDRDSADLFDVRVMVIRKPASGGIRELFGGL
jgi:SIR2-like domain